MPRETPRPRPKPRRWPRRVGIGLAGALLLVAGAVGVRLLTLPDVAALASENPTHTAFVGRYEKRTGDDVTLRWVPWSRIDPDLRYAVVAAEDSEFLDHDGFSTHEMREAIRKAVRERRPPRGASTISQQLVKNLWLSPSRSPLRKLEEAILTRRLERDLSKKRILELYLNVVEFGPGVYGVGNAAPHFFGRPPDRLTERQAAMLAASLPRPSSWHPGVESAAYARYVETILGRMRGFRGLRERIDGL